MTTSTSVSSPNEEKTAARRRLLVLGLVLTAQLMVVLDATIVNIALPDISSALDFTPTGLSWVINAYTLVFGGLLLLGARAGDILGRRKVFLGGIALFTVASLAGGFATSAGLLLGARAVQGVGAALAAPSALALLMTMFPDAKERTKAIGYYTAVSIGGSAVGLISGGMLTQWVSWRWVLFVNVPIGLAVIAVALRVLPETARRPGHFDLAGAITSTLGMTGLVYGFVRAASDGWGDSVTVTAFAAGVVLLAAFIAVELRASSPIVPLRLFANRDRATSYVARLLLVAGMMGMFFFLTQFLQDVLHYSAVVTGVAFLPLTVVLFAASQISARVLTGRVPAKTVMAGGLTLSTIGLLWLTQLHATSGYTALLFPLVLFGIGNGLAFVPLTSTALRGVDPADAGAASGLVNVMQQVGGALGLAVLVTVFGSASRSAVSPAGASAVERAQHAFVVGADRGFLIAALFLAATVILVLVAIRPQPKPAASVETSFDGRPDAATAELDADVEELRAATAHA
ncbi:drug resistance transporter, EmrB/QacA subfamily [Nakamurella panacisegetis]|uniref:Drug resistance transporter, EmrB/QacA subfamily n=1 Tax=Nakamurella panacisegetis TaxID=1090615 RepID=A0A1H0IM60_9ACTN|nr:MFS transporter [Nakamurella panacisegetis]SDO32564.1 drug resistance transporter, EmrB/QacA subfamily [Nakamurella panacisegetis]